MDYEVNAAMATRVNLRDVGWSFPVDTSYLPCSSRKDIGLVYDDSIYITGRDMTDEFFEAVQWAEGSYDENEAEDFMLTLVKEAECYLVFAENCGQYGESAYSFATTVLETIYRDYDSSIFPEAASRGGKTLVCQEFSHDTPTGARTVIIALTDREADHLENACFKEVETFVEEHVCKVNL